MSGLHLFFLLFSLLIGFGLGMGAFFIFRRIVAQKKRDEAELEAERIVQKAKASSSKLERDASQKAKEFEIRARKNLETDIKKQKQKVQQIETQLQDKEQRLEKDYKRKEDQLENRLKNVEEKDERLKVLEQRILDSEKKLVLEAEDLQGKLQSVASMTKDQAREELKRALEEEVRKESAVKLSAIEADMAKEAKERALRSLSIAISRFASEVATERTIATVALTGDDMKGKIIGREGRNIRALEAACGVDLIIDETPDSVVISCFDPVRREVARMALDRLMADGRVHPARIEEVVDKVKSELTNTIKADGEQACFELGVHGVHPGIIGLLGSLKYRITEGQNLLKHSVEVGHAAGLLAAEIGFDVKLAKRAGLLHDIGQAIEHTVEGNHATAGADFARRHGERDDVCHALRAHHDDEEPQTILAHLVQAANNLSKARPGARKQMMESYIRRLEDLESIGNSFDGVERTFAIQAGKEIRVLVDSGKVTDDQAIMLSRDISRKIERELNYPGEIKVVVVRETRMVEHAR